MQTRLLLVAVVVLVLLGSYVWWSGSQDAEGDEPLLEEGEVALFPDLEPADVIGLTLGTPGKQVTLERQGESDWLLVSAAPLPADDALVEAAARAAVSLVSDRQLAEGQDSLADFGLGEDAFGLVLQIEGGTSHHLRLGDTAPVGGGRYVLLVETGAIHLVDGWSVRPLERDPAEFRDRRILPLDPDDLTEVRLTRTGLPPLVLERRGTRWFVQAEPAWRVDTGLVRDLLVELVELRARDYLDSAGDETFEPDVEILVRGDGGGSARLQLGPAAPDGLREARTVGELLPVADGERARLAASFLDELDPDPVVWRTFELLDFNPWIVESIEHSAGGRTWRLENRDGDWLRVGADPDVPLDAEKVQALLGDLDSLRAVAYAPTDLDPVEAGVQQARIELVQSDGVAAGLTLYRGSNRDHVEVDGEPGLREVDASVHALIGHLRPLEPDALEPSAPVVESDP